MGWFQRHWPDDEEAIARLESRYAATGDPLGNASTDRGSEKKDGDEK